MGLETRFLSAASRSRALSSAFAAVSADSTTDSVFPPPLADSSDLSCKISTTTACASTFLFIPLATSPTFKFSLTSRALSFSRRRRFAPPTLPADTALESRFSPQRSFRAPDDVRFLPEVDARFRESVLSGVAGGVRERRRSPLLRDGCVSCRFRLSWSGLGLRFRC